MPFLNYGRDRAVGILIGAVPYTIPQSGSVPTVLVGLTKLQPDATWDGYQGVFGEPASGGLYKRAASDFTDVSAGIDTKASNRRSLVFTGLPAGTYSYFVIAGNPLQGGNAPSLTFP